MWIETIPRGKILQVPYFPETEMKNVKTFFLKHFEGSLILLILVGILAIAFLVHFKFAFLNFFFLPVILAGYFLGKKEAVLISILSILLVVLYILF